MVDTQLSYLTGYKTHRYIRCTLISAGQIEKNPKKNQSTNIKREEINIMNIIIDNSFNQHN